jgi:hypothetical protein
MASGCAVLIQDSEDRVIGCHLLVVCEGRFGAEADMRSSSRREADVLLDDGRSTFNGHLFEPYLAPPTANQVGLARGPDVPHPFALSEHRHEIVLALIPGYDERDSVGTTRPARTPRRYTHGCCRPGWTRAYRRRMEIRCRRTRCRRASRTVMASKRPLGRA